MSWYFSKRVTVLEEELQALRARQHLKLEELKEKFDYYRTQKIIERFENDPEKRKKRSQDSKEPSPPSSPSLSSQASASQVPNLPQSTASPVASEHLVRPRGWLDRITDYILGEEEVSQRYALICSKCFAHNGLSLTPRITFSCRNCHFLNNEVEHLIQRSLPDVNSTPIAENRLRRKRS